MTLDRRRFLQLSAASAATPLIAACGDDGPVSSVDTRLPNGPFGAESTAMEVTDGLDLSGQTLLVTGCNSGLGYETLRVLAARGAHVIGTGRTLEKAQGACDSVGGKTTPVALELSNFDSAVACAETVKAMGVPLDGMILNAGINTFGDLELIGGIERMFVVNFLGHFVLVEHLLDTMNTARESRIVHVGSRSGYMQAPAVGIDFDNLRGEGVFDAGEAYGRSKLANALFSLELAKRLEGTTTTSNVIHPGLVQTNIARTAPAIMRGAFEMFGGAIAKSPEQGAATQVYVAVHPTVAGVSGAYFEDCNPVTISGDNHMFNKTMATRLWQVAEEMTQSHRA